MYRSATALALAAVVFAACGGPGASPTPAAVPVVQLASSALGQIVADASGRTLYGFTPDEASGQPTCTGSCADNWPAFTVSSSFTVGSGLDQSKFSTVTATTGGTQLKFGNYPLYYFAGDTAANQTNGQGVGGKWYVVGADGALIGM